MTRRKLDQIIDLAIAKTAAAHGLNTTPEAKGGDLGDAMALLGRVIDKQTDSLVAATNPPAAS